MALEQQLYTVDDVWEIAHLPENRDKRIELYEGMIFEVPPSFEPSHIAIQIASPLNVHVRKHNLGYVTGADGGYVITENTRFIPDVGFISKARLPEKPERDVPVPPDLAVEVVSPTDTQIGAHRKAMTYIAHGTMLVWVVYPDDETVHVYTPSVSGANVVVIDRDGTLDGGDVVKGFTLAVKDIFFG